MVTGRRDERENGWILALPTGAARSDPGLERSGGTGRGHPRQRTHFAQEGPKVFHAAAPELKPVKPSSKLRPQA